ncbi:Tat pathway signal protein [Streptomyces sp. CRPSP2-6A1]|uniref:Tat pathway signal protein n=1 Tax=Streptomyces sp. CRPSP2-6A1 TaxID=2799588 RepID=UPI0018F06CA0|nr:Tat pathway signal protein [Streptomyces sp. CRPSP2-6A1]MBJ7004990.1 Tat pathway signal protein [Streptomyces sp. CRPSP2-6A1]
MARERNVKLADAIAETGWSQQKVAAAFVRVAAEVGAKELLGTSRSHIAMWVAGTQPSGRAPLILCETLSRRLQRPITPAEIGLSAPGAGAVAASEWNVDTLTALVDLGRSDVDLERRRLLAGAAYSVGGLILPGPQWWDEAPQRAKSRPAATSRRVGGAEVSAVREMTEFFSRRDQRHGGMDGRTALYQYLVDDVARYVGGVFTSDDTRRALLAAASEAVYVAGWMSFDASHHEAARRYFTLALKLAAEADDAPLAGHILRAMAHQATDLGHPRTAVDLATASLERKRYSLATSRERALLGVVQARSLAADGQKHAAIAALLRAEDDLAATDDGDEDPSRVWFFQQASLAHETARTLWTLGDLDGALREFSNSVLTRKADTFSRTHAVTLGYMGTVQARKGNVEAACHTWGQALDAMEGVQSGRAREAAVNMRRVLSPFRNRGISVAAEIDERAKSVLERVA